MKKKFKCSVVVELEDDQTEIEEREFYAKDLDEAELMAWEEVDVVDVISIEETK